MGLRARGHSAAIRRSRAIPTRKVSGRLTVTYAGFEGESTLLEGLYKRGRASPWHPTSMPAMEPGTGRTAGGAVADPGMARPDALSLRANSTRMIENRWVTTESNFVDMAWWDACVETELRPVIDRYLPVWVGVDASVKRDSTAIVVHLGQKARECDSFFIASFSRPRMTRSTSRRTIEATLLDLHRLRRTRDSLRSVSAGGRRAAIAAHRPADGGVCAESRI